MKKQQGFTLIELMVVMAIIAILATAGLAAYTGYIKKARDTTRIADISAINTIVLGQVSSNGKPLATPLEVYNAVMAANNGQPVVDPLTTVASGLTTHKSVCMDAAGTGFTKECSYTYRICDGGAGFAVGTRFESTANLSLYTDDSIGTAGSRADNTLYEVGSCTTECTALDTPSAGCPATYFNPNKLECATTYVSPNCTVSAATIIGA